jgi:NAD(P)-dependent dehydrogenase (short-subunit alcohol dehydrogenase family)
MKQDSVTMEPPFVNKIVMITGASRGIGKAIATKFIETGAIVILLCREKETCTQLIKGLEDKVFVLNSNISHEKDIRAGVDFAINSFGRIDILINNAGICYVSKFLEISDQEWNDTFDINVKSIFYICKAILPIMQKQKSGKIINIASQAGKNGEAYNSAYSASKFAVIGLTQSLAKEFGEYNIQINSVCPGATETEMLHQAIRKFAKINQISDEQFRDFLINNIPARRFATPDEIANLVIFLSSDQANYINGASIGVTGAATMF